MSPPIAATAMSPTTLPLSQLGHEAGAQQPDSGSLGVVGCSRHSNQPLVVAAPPATLNPLFFTAVGSSNLTELSKSARFTATPPHISPLFAAKKVESAA